MSLPKIRGTYTGTYMHGNGKAAKVTKMYAPTDSAIHEKSFYTDGRAESTGLLTIRPYNNKEVLHRSGEVVVQSEEKESHVYNEYETCESISAEEFNAVLDTGSPYFGMQQMMSTMITSPKDTYVKCTSSYKDKLIENYKSYGNWRVQHVGGLKGQLFDHAAVYYKQS